MNSEWILITIKKEFLCVNETEEETETTEIK